MAKNVRHIMKIELSAGTAAKYDKVADHHGMTQVAVNSRLVEWLAGQDPAIREAVLVPGRMIHRELARMILTKLAAG